MQNASAHYCPSWLVDHGQAGAIYVPAMTTARFRFADALSPFLTPERRGTGLGYDCARAASLKKAIEPLGVPHTQLGRGLVSPAPATLHRTVREGDDLVLCVLA